MLRYTGRDRGGRSNLNNLDLYSLDHLLNLPDMFADIAWQYGQEPEHVLVGQLGLRSLDLACINFTSDI